MLSFLYSFWDTLLQSLGLSQKQGNLLLIGLDNAGKTTLLHRLRTGSLPQHFPPTDRPSQNEFRHGGIQFQAWDMGGHEVVRHLWSEYLDGTGNQSNKKMAVLFCIDAADPERLEEAGYELDNLLFNHIKNDEDDYDPNTTSEGGDNDMSDLPPVAILLNKCDLNDQALSTSEICERIEYNNLISQYDPERMAIFRISVLKGEGYQAAFQWIAKFL